MGVDATWRTAGPAAIARHVLVVAPPACTMIEAVLVLSRAHVAAVVGERDAFLASMVSYSPAQEASAARLVSVLPHDADGPRPTHQAVICAFDPTSVSPVALMDGTHVTAARAARGSALASRLLARGDAAVMAVLGTGAQARAHARLVPREAAPLGDLPRGPGPGCRAPARGGSGQRAP